MSKIICAILAEIIFLIGAAVIDADWLKESSYWLLPLCVAGIVVTAIVGHVLKCRKERQKLEPPVDNNPNWMPLHEALHYLVYDSEWARLQSTPATETEFDEIVSDEFLEQLARNEINVRGRHYYNAAQLNKTTQPIPPDYWVEGFIQPHGEIVLADGKRGFAGRSCENNRYDRIILNRIDIEKVWPQSSQSSLSPMAQFVEPLRRQIAEEKKQHEQK